MKLNSATKKIEQVSKKLSVLLPLGMGILGVLVLVISTNQGPGIAGDATIYLKCAENLLAGKGLGLIGPQGEFRLLPYFPPFFPLMISFLGLFGFNLVDAAHWLNMLMFGGLISLAGWSALRVTRSWVLSLLLMFFLLASPVLVPIYSWVMSEPLCFFLGFAGLVLLFEALRKEKPGLLFFCSALLTGLSFLTRYSSIAFVAAAALGWLILSKRPWRLRIWDMLRYGLAAVLPMFVWIIYDVMQTNTLASRSMENAAEIAWRFSNLWPSLEEVMLFWVIPNSWVFTPRYHPNLNHLLFLVLVVVALAWLFIVVKKLLHNLEDEYFLNHLRSGVILLIFFIAYLAVISIVYTFTFPPITIYHRMLSPMHIAALWLVILCSSVSFQLLRHYPGLIRLLTLALFFMIFWYGWRTERIIQRNYQVGFGFTAPEWRESETIKKLKEIQDDTLIVTNEQNAVLFLTDRPAYPMKEIYRVEPLSVFFSFGQGDLESDETQRMFRDGAALVLFNSIHRQMGDLYKDQAEDRIQKLTEGLYKAFEGNDGAIYYIDEKASQK